MMDDIQTHYENKKLGLTLDFLPVTQAQVVVFAREVRAAGEVTEIEMRSVRVRAAIKAGWISAPAMSVDMVDPLAPAAARWWSEKVSAYYTAVTTVPPD